jgi:hypothetical protein
METKKKRVKKTKPVAVFKIVHSTPDNPIIVSFP